jgi:ribosomal 30S subunit maturation factor RimM
MENYINIVGFEVFSQDGNYIGIIRDIIKSEKYADILIVKNYNSEVLIPVLYNKIHYINLMRKKIFFIFPKGYSDIYKPSMYLDDNYNILNSYYYCLYEN